MWSLEHLFTLVPCLILFVAISLLLRKFLLNKDEEYKLIPIGIVAGLLVILEIIKQIKSIMIGYNFYHIPLHFCSLFIFLFPMFYLYRNRFKNEIRLLTLLSGFILLVLMLIFPTAVYSANDITTFFQDFFAFHTVIFHNLVLFGVIYIFALELYEIKLKHDLKYCPLVYLIYCVLAATTALLTKINFNKFYKNINAIDGIRLGFIESFGYAGQVLYTILSIGIVMFFTFVCYALLFCTDKAIKKIKNHKHKSQSK